MSDQFAFCWLKHQLLQYSKLGLQAAAKCYSNPLAKETDWPRDELLTFQRMIPLHLKAVSLPTVS